MGPGVGAVAMLFKVESRHSRKIKTMRQRERNRERKGERDK